MSNITHTLIIIKRLAKINTSRILSCVTRIITIKNKGEYITMQTTIKDVKNEEIILSSDNLQASQMIESINQSIKETTEIAHQLRQNRQYTTANNLFTTIKGLQMAKRNIVKVLHNNGMNELDVDWKHVN